MFKFITHLWQDVVFINIFLLTSVNPVKNF